jgi:hypothetical protein
VAVAALGLAASAGVGGDRLVRWVSAPAPWRFGPTPRIAAPGPLQIRPPAGYHIVYLVATGTPPAVESEDVAVERPFRSHIVTRQGAAPHGRILADEVSDFGLVREAAPGSPAVVVARPPAAGLDDVRLDASLGDLETRHALAPLGWRRVLGRPCEVFRSTAVLQAATLAPLPPRPDSYVDSCVDSAGLVLEELQYSGHTLISRRQAVEVSIGIPRDRAQFTIREQPTVSFSQGGGRVVKVSGTTVIPGAAWTLAPPPGFEYLGRYAVADPSSSFPSGGLPMSNRQAGFTDIWVRGPDFVLLDQGGPLYGGDSPPADPLGRPIDVPGVGPASVVPGAQVSTVRVDLPAGRYVQIEGTLPPAQLADLALQLRPQAT